MTNVTSAVGIELAAGHGRRLGGRKSRLVIAGDPLVLHHVRAFAAAGARAIVVAHPEDVALVDSTAKVVVSEEEQQSGSLSIGVRALPSDADVVFITPVDALPATVATFAALASALTSSGTIAATPIFQGRRGHPVAVRRSALGPYEAGSTPPPLRDWLASLGAARMEVSVDDPNVVTDLDDAVRVIAATGAPPRFT